MNHAGGDEGEIEGNINVVEVGFAVLLKVDAPLDGARWTDPDVEGVHHRLPKVLLKRLLPQSTQVDPVERRLIPKRGKKPKATVKNEK